MSTRVGDATLHLGDMLDLLQTLPPESIDACVTDPPYGLGFMGKQWDTPGSFVERKPEKRNRFDHVGGNHNPTCSADASRTRRAENERFGVWCWAWALQVFPLLKPGAHLIAFGGTRTYHRMVCAIEDAGFEIRDQLAWVYGSGFPKSHDIGKAIDRLGAEDGVAARIEIARLIEASGKTDATIAEHVGVSSSLVRFWRLNERNITPAQVDTLKNLLACPELKQGSRENIGINENYRELQSSPSSYNLRRNRYITAPATDAARQWDGWGTALKPAHEPIVLARKPLAERTVAAQVLANGCGALHVEACRVPTEPDDKVLTFDRTPGERSREQYRTGTCRDARPSGAGRWPANLLHDGSPEVLEAFGSAARFFYSAKAGPDDRLGSKHPTVKPVALMRWLVRLITPPGGTVLDPFMGTGTTLQAALLEGFKAVGVEREAEYFADALRRLQHMRGEDTGLFTPPPQRPRATVTRRPRPTSTRSDPDEG